MFNGAFWLRDVTNKLVRRVKKALGRPDPTPWILRPDTSSVPARSRRAYVDFIVGIDFLHAHSTLPQLFHRAMAPLGLSVLVANKHNVQTLTQQVQRGRIRPHVYLDLCSATNDAFAELLQTMSRAGVYAIGQPEKLAQWTWKARAQRPIEEAGLPVPPTVVIRADEPTRELTADQRLAIGERCVIKPSWGVAGLGVMAGVKPTAQNIAQARQFNPKDDYLVQRMIKWETIGARSAYLRGYNILGTRNLMWWAPETRKYEMVTWDEFREHDLMGAVEIIDRMAALTGMDFFSSEIAITSGVGQPRFVLIDYCNDQCDMNPATVQTDGTPLEWSRWACERFAEFVWQKKHGVETPPGHSLWLWPGGSGTPRASRLIHAA